MARLVLSAGQTFGTIGPYTPATEVIGTNSNETVFVEIDGRATFDASFNRGGDIINIQGSAALYKAAVAGSNIVITSDGGASVTIPVGTTGTAVNFTNLNATLKFENGAFKLGSTVLTGTPTQLAPTPAASSSEQVTSSEEYIEATPHAALFLSFDSTVTTLG